MSAAGFYVLAMSSRLDVDADVLALRVYGLVVICVSLSYSRTFLNMYGVSSIHDVLGFSRNIEERCSIIQVSWWEKICVYAFDAFATSAISRTITLCD